MHKQVTFILEKGRTREQVFQELVTIFVYAFIDNLEFKKDDLGRLVTTGKEKKMNITIKTENEQS